MRPGATIRRLITRLGGDRAGATIVEFAIVAPVMALLMMGLGDLLYQFYVKAVLNGSIQKAARDSSIQGGANQTAVLDAKITEMVQRVAKKATISVVRRNYDAFTYVGPERFTDTNSNGVRNAGECFTDINRNGVWDADPGANGQGGANDIASYTVTVSYPRLFPLGQAFGWGSTATITSQTLLKNQPYENQTTVTPATICT